MTALWKFLLSHKRWWIFFLLVVSLCLLLIFFGQSTPLVSFIYVFF